ncbi:efflux RND transporter periplasmic adaptor subunit [Chryseolinea lacunae]|uniref:Efflux RND transporter periplasmic adaptor subunit n=1 Tax=Chryseolinea lacunae TaxID=2801331 RepID=A0ABS1L3W1_9BACT|nr:efflux RND transporter periplasmic adaptor subunit [Chryseolinea lacunae]MBL0745251.1 efflux RND transporter periplasmic adaptor subunit [Chryseolinea lacunae]
MKNKRRNNPKRFVLRAALLFMMVVALAACKHQEESHDEYTCPMHPTVLADKPGTCPVCGMDLVRKARSGEEVTINNALVPLLKSTNESVVSSVKTVKGEYRTVPLTLQTNGIITYDTRKSYTIAARTGGRLEKVYLKYAFQPVKKGQKIAELYSPELLTAQRELLMLVESDAGNTDLVASAKRRLELLGMSSTQVQQLTTRKTISNTFPIYSPYDGYVVSEQKPATAPLPDATAQAAPADGMGGGMAGSAGSASVASGAAQSQSTVLLREGSYVSQGQTLFNIVSHDALRIELDVPASQAGTIRTGDQLTLDFGNGTQEQATVDFIQPFFSQGQEFLKLRVYAKHLRDLHIGHLVRAAIQLNAVASLWVPRDAVMDMGRERLVFVKAHGLFKPKTVTTGVHAKGWIEIKEGLATADEIAANAHYLVDSESFVKTTP